MRARLIALLASSAAALRPMRQCMRRRDLGSATAMALFVGYQRQVGGVDVKIDANLMRLKQEIEVFGISAETTETKIKITPGIGYTMGKLAAEIDYDIAGDWAGINLYYSLGE